MSEKSRLINKLITTKTTRQDYIWSKVTTNVASQIRALRRRRSNMTQQALAQEVEMKQSRISAMERPGTRFNIETLVRLASAFKVGLVVKFVSFGEMLKWENGYSQDTFNPLTIDKDAEFQRHKAPAEPNVLNYTVNSGYCASGKQVLEEIMNIGARLVYEDVLRPDQSTGTVIPIGKAKSPYLPSQMIGEAHNPGRVSIHA